MSSETLVSDPVASVKKVIAKKPAVSKAKPTHPKFFDMISEAIKKLNDRSGSSRQAIIKFIMATYHLDEKTCTQHTKVALRAGVKSNMLKQSSGTGASGSFKLGEAAKLKEKAAEKKAKSATKPKKEKVVKKKSAEKKIVTKKSVAKSKTSNTKTAVKTNNVVKTKPPTKKTPAKVRLVVKKFGATPKPTKKAATKSKTTKTAAKPKTTKTAAKPNTTKTATKPKTSKA